MAELFLQRRLPDDVLEYMLVPQLPEGLDDNDVHAFLEKLCDTYLGHLGPLIIDYIWQNESFVLKPVTVKADTPPHLYGQTNFGDNIEDEWFIVYLLFELSKQYPDLVIRVSDNDEEFLLIEAADHLPTWLDPETAEKRVYIHQSSLHIIPMPKNTEESSTFPLFTPTIEEAVALVRNTSLKTKASQQVQDDLSRRLNSNRAKMQENTHYANLYVPVSVAALLKERPALVAAAVQAFYYRDPVELKVCRTMNHFKPENMVVSRLRFTRCLYAQLQQQRFQPDKRSGWVLPSPSNPKFKEQDLGMKLAHGFEILCARCNSSSGGSGKSAGSPDGVSDVRWSRFVKSLHDKGYFKGELEGSVLYNKLLEDARRFFHSQSTDLEKTDCDLAQEVVQLLPQLSCDVGPWKQLEKSLAPSDDDSWLDLTPETLDEMMKSAAGIHGNMEREELDLQKVASSMNDFVNKVSSVDGVEFPTQGSNKDRDDGEGEGEVDGTSFIHAMQKMFDFKDDDQGSSSDMSEYDWEEESDEELGSPTSKPKPPGTRPAVPAPNHPPAPRPPPPRPTAKPPARPAKPPAIPTKPPSRPARPARTGARRKDPEIEAIMDAMDRELAQTEVGKSFEREPPRPKPLRFQPPKRTEQNGASTAQSTSSGGASKLVNRPTKPPSSRPQRPPPPTPPKPSSATNDIDDEDDGFRPVNIDVNVVKNTLESFRAQQGLPGPASNILHNMGILLPPDEDEPAA